MAISSSSSLLLTGFSLLLLPLIGAFPGGIGGCQGGQAAVGGPHWNIYRQTGTLRDGGLEMVLDDQHVLSWDQQMDFTLGQDHTLTLRKTASGKSFKGFLFRLGTGPVTTVDTTNALDRLDSQSSVSFEFCIAVQGVGGIGHTNPNLKDSVSGKLRMDVEASNMPLEVTVVIANYAGVSEFYYQKFMLNAVTGATGPGAPFAGPTVPTRPPVPPVFSQQPNVAPPVMPEQSPAPVVAPSVAPVMPPTSVAPVMPPTTVAPVMPPTSVAPVMPPVMPPTIGSSAPVPGTPQKKTPDAAKCDSLAQQGGRGGAAAQAKDCTRRVNPGTRRKLKGSNY